MKALKILFFISIFFVASCNNNNDVITPISLSNKGLAGSYKLSSIDIERFYESRTTDGVAYFRQTIQSTGVNENVSLTINENGTYSIFGNYTLVSEFTVLNQTPLVYSKESNLNTSGTFELETDNLLATDNYLATLSLKPGIDFKLHEDISIYDLDVNYYNLNNGIKSIDNNILILESKESIAEHRSTNRRTTTLIFIKQ